MSLIPATAKTPEDEEPDRSAMSGDPFLDASIGPNAWAKVAPRGSQYWVTVLALAIGLTLFSVYWRATWLPSQPLDWPVATEFTLQQAIGLRRPILVWCEGDSRETSLHTAERNTAERNIGEQEMVNAEVADAIKRLDVEPVRVRLRMKSAFLAKVDSYSGPAIQRILGWEASRDSSGLLLMHPQVGPSKLLTPTEISPERVLAWLNGGGE